MKIKLYIYTLLSIAFLGFASLGFSQEEPVVVPKDVPEQAVAGEENISWVWGEVKSIDAAASIFSIIYMDYQTDEEKELTLNIGQDTKYEGVSDFSAIKVGDTAGIDYMIKEGKNIAQNISVEKIEAMPEVPLQGEAAATEVVTEQKN